VQLQCCPARWEPVWGPAAELRSLTGPPAGCITPEGSRGPSDTAGPGVAYLSNPPAPSRRLWVLYKHWLLWSMARFLCDSWGFCSPVGIYYTVTQSCNELHTSDQATPARSRGRDMLPIFRLWRERRAQLNVCRKLLSTSHSVYRARLSIY